MNIDYIMCSGPDSITLNLLQFRTHIKNVEITVGKLKGIFSLQMLPVMQMSLSF